MQSKYNSQKLKQISLLLSIAVALLGIVVLSGWIGDVAVLKNISAGWASMKVNTAICFLLSGITLIILNRQHQRRIDAAAAGFFSLVILLLTTAILLQYVFNINLGIDELFFTDNTVSSEFAYPGRPAPQTAICFLLTGASLFLISIKKSTSLIFQWLALASGLIAFFALAGYIFGANQLKGISNYTIIALHSAIGLLCIMLATFFLLPEAGIMKMISSNTMGGRLVRNTFPFISIVIIVIGWLRLQGQLAGWYDTRLGIALYSISFIIVFGITLFYNGIILNKAQKEQLDTQDELQKSLKEISDYKHALDESSIVAITDQKGIIRHVNDNFCNISKYSRQELIGQDHRIINSGYHTKEFIRALWVTIASGKIWRGEIRNKAKDGSFYWVYTTIVPFCNKEGRPYQYASIRVDITDRKKIEEVLETLSKEKETTLNRISDSLISFDNEWRYTFINDAAMALNPFSKEETIGKKILEVQPELESTKLWGIFQEAMRTKKVMEAETFYEHYNIWVLCKLYPSADGLTLYYNDITERKNAEEKLFRLNEELEQKVLLKAEELVMAKDQLAENSEKLKFLATIADNIQDPVISSDTGFFITKWNKAAEKLLEWKSEEVIGKSGSEILRSSYLNVTREQIIESLSTNHSWQGEGIYYSKSGKPVNVLITTSQLKDNSDNVTGYFAIVRDITDRKKTEAEINSLNESLETKVLERTRQLEAANKELESFTYSVSHDLRAPLRAVTSYTQILAEDHFEHLDEDGKTILKNVLYNGQKMAHLIDELLAFSKLGRKEIIKTEVDMNKLTSHVLDDLKDIFAHEADVQVAPLPVVQADYSLLYQVMFNLLSNAIKYSSKKEQPVVRIITEDKDGKIVFAIKDNGAGFDMQYADKLFGVFQRLHLQTEFEGHGVGLANVHRIITKLGGKVWGEGKINEGATFYFTLN